MPKVVRQLVKTSTAVSQVSMTGLFNQLRGKYHRHYCINRECRLFYEDACADTEHNAVCPLCRGTTRSNAAWMDPQECCINNTKQVVDRDELLRYQLAGPGPWFQCKACARTHGWPCKA